MSKTDPQPSTRRADLGATFDAWYPRVMKIVGLSGVVACGVLWAMGLFNPVVFGACFTLASGGFVGDALSALKPPRE